MLVKRVRELGQAWALCSDSGVEVKQNKSRAYWFLTLALSESAYCLLPPETLLSILHDLPSQSSSLWHATIFSSCSGDREYLFHGKTSPYPLAVILCIVVRHFRGKQFRVCPSLPFPSCQNIQFAQFKSLINSWFIKNGIYYSFLWQGGIIA